MTALKLINALIERVDVLAQEEDPEMTKFLIAELQMLLKSQKINWRKKCLTNLKELQQQKKLKISK